MTPASKIELLINMDPVPFVPELSAAYHSAQCVIAALALYRHQPLER